MVGDAIIEIARGQGAEPALAMGGASSAHFRRSLQCWSLDNALKLHVMKNDQHNLQFNRIGHATGRTLAP